MPRKREDRLEDWITSREAAEILTNNSGHKVSTDYVRLLGNAGKLTTRPIGERIKLYLRSDVEAYTVDTKRGPKAKEVKPAA